MRHRVVLGVDSGTQSTKVVAFDLDSGGVRGVGRSSHSGSDVQHPNEWWTALRDAIADLPREDLDIAGISVAGQQHGCVALDDEGHVVRPASLWNDLSSATDAERLNAMADFPSATGLFLVASFTIAKIAHLARTHPEDLAVTKSVCLPHDWLNYQLTGRLCTDRGDASGTGWWAPSQGRYRRDLLSLAIGPDHAERLELPEVLGPNEPAGVVSDRAARELGLPAGIPVGPGTGDNMAAALGIGADTGELVISLGTSGTAFTISETPITDPSGDLAGFADASGRFMPLACMINCTRVVDTVAASYGMSRKDALDIAGEESPGAGGIIMLPYLSGERTPNLPSARGVLTGLTDENMAPARILRAALDGVVAGIVYCLDALKAQGFDNDRITLVGGGARHPVWQHAIADASGRTVEVRAGEEHAARGAAIQAAAILSGVETVEMSRRWRPKSLQEITPVEGYSSSFRLEERLSLIADLRSRITNFPDQDEAARC